jgi:hypothetical protein
MVPPATNLVCQVNDAVINVALVLQPLQSPRCVVQWTLCRRRPSIHMHEHPRELAYEGFVLRRPLAQ